MKKIFLILLVLSFNLYGALTAPYFGMNVNLQGASYFSSYGDVKSQYRMQPMLQSTWDLKLGKKVFFLGQFGSQLPLSSGVYEDGAYVFTGVGVGWYLFDDRTNGRGSSLTMSISCITKSSLSMRAPVAAQAPLLDTDDTLHNDILYDDYHYGNYISSGGVGGQLLVSYYYNIFKHLAFKVGFNFNIYPVDTVVRSGYSGDGVGIESGISLGIAF